MRPGGTPLAVLGGHRADLPTGRLRAVLVCPLPERFPSRSITKCQSKVHAKSRLAEVGRPCDARESVSGLSEGGPPKRSERDNSYCKTWSGSDQKVAGSRLTENALEVTKKWHGSNHEPRPRSMAYQSRPPEINVEGAKKFKKNENNFVQPLFLKRGMKLDLPGLNDQ